jgi:hypothetical protein
MPAPRYITAYTPPPESPLARFGAGVLGYDCFRGVDVPWRAAGGVAPAILRLMTVELRRFGFHAGFMTPFGFGARPEADLLTELARFARANRVVPVGPLGVAMSGARIVLQPVAPPAQLGDLAAACFDRLVNDKPKARQKTLSHDLIKIARLRGCLARASDPPPGNTVMWRGLSRLTDIALGAMVGGEFVGN